MNLLQHLLGKKILVCQTCSRCRFYDQDICFRIKNCERNVHPEKGRYGFQRINLLTTKLWNEDFVPMLQQMFDNRHYDISSALSCSLYIEGMFIGCRS